jgi:hypothetical protein
MCLFLIIYTMKQKQKNIIEIEGKPGAVAQKCAECSRDF